MRRVQYPGDPERYRRRVARRAGRRCAATIRLLSRPPCRRDRDVWRSDRRLAPRLWRPPGQSRLLRDVLVKIEGSPDLLLGKAHLDFGRWLFAGYFLLER